MKITFDLDYIYELAVAEAKRTSGKFGSATALDIGLEIDEQMNVTGVYVAIPQEKAQ